MQPPRRHRKKKRVSTASVHQDEAQADMDRDYSQDCAGALSALQEAVWNTLRMSAPPLTPARQGGGEVTGHGHEGADEGGQRFNKRCRRDVVVEGEGSFPLLVAGLEHEARLVQKRVQLCDHIAQIDEELRLLRRKRELGWHQPQQSAEPPLHHMSTTSAGRTDREEAAHGGERMDAGKDGLTNGQRWLVRLAQLREFNRHHGHTRVPRYTPSSSTFLHHLLLHVVHSSRTPHTAHRTRRAEITRTGSWRRG